MDMNELELTEFEVHVFVRGQTHRLVSTDLDVGDLTPNTEIKSAVENALGLIDGALSTFTVTKQESGDLVLDPPATLG